MNNSFFLVPGKNSHSLYHNFFHTTKRVRVAEDNFQNEYPIVSMQGMTWFLVHKNLVMEVELKLRDGRWYIIPGFRISYSHVNSWKYQDVSNLDEQYTSPLNLDAFIQYDASQNNYHIVEKEFARKGDIFIPAEEIWNSPNMVTLPNVVRDLTIRHLYDGCGAISYKRAYDGFAAILKERGIRYSREDVRRMIKLGEYSMYDKEISIDMNTRRLAIKKLDPMTLTYNREGYIAGDSNQLSIRLQYGSAYHTGKVAELLGI